MEVALKLWSFQAAWALSETAMRTTEPSLGTSMSHTSCVAVLQRRRVCPVSVWTVRTTVLDWSTTNKVAPSWAATSLVMPLKAE
jgi:hypothetical protein